MLFGRELVKQDLENDQGRRNAVVLEGTVQVTLLPAGPCRMVVGHIVAVVDAVDLVTDTVIAIETAHVRTDEEAVVAAVAVSGLECQATESHSVRRDHSCYCRLIEVTAGVPQDRKQDDRRRESHPS